MPTRVCMVCNRLQRIASRDLQYLDKNGDFVCSESCVASWIRLHEFRENQDPLAEWKAVPTRYEGQFRSRYELLVSEWMDAHGIRYQYEKYGFLIGDRGQYTPDFYLIDFGVFIEVKGKWGVGSQSKLLRFREQYPSVRLLVVPWTLLDSFALWGSK